MKEQLVLSEDEALELLGFLFAAARVQIDESPRNGPMRLLMTAERLSAFIKGRASPETQALLDLAISEVPDMFTRISDSEAYVASLDKLCRAAAEHLSERNGLKANAS